MSYLRRQSVPKSWPVTRKKGNSYLISPSTNKNSGIPLLVLLRDVMGIVQTRRELKKALHQNNIKINQKECHDEKTGLTLFDVITLVPSKKNYRVTLKTNGKYDIEEIKESDSDRKVTKVDDKKVLKGKKTQLNLSDGRNFLSEIKCSVSDSVIINFKDKKIEKCIPIKEKANVFVISGKHAGKKGIIKNIEEEKKLVNIGTEDGDIQVLIKQVMTIE